MESVVLLGLMGVGYLINKDKDDKHKVYNNVNPPINVNSGNSVYDLANYSDSKKHEIDLVNKNHSLSMKGDSKMIDSLNLPGGRNTLKDTIMGNNNYIKSISGEEISKDDFLLNDQGVKVEPFFSRDSSPQNLNDNQSLINHQGGSHAFRSQKREIGQFFELEKDYGNVFGNQFSGIRADSSRYDNGMMRTNERAFESELVAPIDQKSNLNTDVALAYAQRNNTDNLRTLNNQKENYGGKILGGKGIDLRSQEGEVFQHTPDQDYVNSADKWLVTTGAINAASINPTQIVKDTNRSHFNDGKLGPAGAVNFNPSQDRPSFKKSTNQQLHIDSNRNMNLESKASDDDHNKDSFHVYPNEREITTERTYEGNLKSMFEGSTERIYDTIKPTVKETTNYEHTGNAGSYLPGTTANDKYYRVELNPNKEVISRGRDPTPENTKLTNGMDTMNVDIHKIENDYFNHRINNMDKLYQDTPVKDTCEYTQEKDTLNNVKLADRLDPNMLDPFRQNPYTHSLASFSY